MEVHPLDAPATQIQSNDLIHLETPLNPTGMALNIRYYADLAHSRGAFLSVDSSLGPPGLQDPFACGADIVMHSGTKYLGGHSDLLCGVLSVRREDWAFGLQKDRIHLGSVMGNMESWLGVRSLRTLDLRVQRQSETAEKLVKWIFECLSPSLEGNSDLQVIRKVVLNVKHASLQGSDKEWLKEQMPNGFGPVFSIMMREEWMAKELPSILELFHHTCSFGSVDSLIEWRRFTDQSVDPRILKVSIGLECWEDLKGDLLSAFRVLQEAM
jgi:cystathionine beta-lyase